MDRPPLTRIVVPTDLSDCSRAAFPLARKVAALAGAEIVLVNVIEHVPTVGFELGYAAVPPGVEHGRLRAERAAVLERVAREFFPGLRVRGTVVIGVPEEEVIEQARRENAELIVMSTHGWTGLKHWLVGSVAERVVRTAPCPVLTVKPAAEAVRLA